MALKVHHRLYSSTCSSPTYHNLKMLWKDAFFLSQLQVVVDLFSITLPITWWIRTSPTFPLIIFSWFLVRRHFNSPKLWFFLIFNLLRAVIDWKVLILEHVNSQTSFRKPDSKTSFHVKMQSKHYFPYLLGCLISLSFIFSWTCSNLQ